MDAKQERIDTAMKRCQAAHAELSAAGDELLAAIGATDDEQEQAAEALADCLNDESAIHTHVGASHWATMLADQVLDDRQYAAEEAEEAEEAKREGDRGR